MNAQEFDKCARELQRKYIKSELAGMVVDLLGSLKAARIRIEELENSNSYPSITIGDRHEMGG